MIQAQKQSSGRHALALKSWHLTLLWCMQSSVLRCATACVANELQGKMLLQSCELWLRVFFT